MVIFHSYVSLPEGKFIYVCLLCGKKNPNNELNHYNSGLLEWGWFINPNHELKHNML